MPSAQKIISRTLDTVGDGSGLGNANGNYLITPQDFKIAPAAGEIFAIHRCIITIQDVGTFEAANYGGKAPSAPLVNGIILEVRNASGLLYPLTAGPVTVNQQWFWHCFDAHMYEFPNQAGSMTMRWTFAKSGRPVVLKGDDGEYLRAEMNDDLTFLTGHFFLVQGYYVKGGGY